MKHIAGQNITAKVFKRSGLLSLARLLQVGISFFIFWLFSIYLSKEEYGTFQKTFVLVSFFSGMCCLGLPVLIASLPSVAAGRYIVDIIKRKFIIYLAAITASSLFILLFTSFIPFLSRLTALLLIFCNGVYLLLEVYLVKLNRDKYVLLNNLVYSLCYVSIHIFFGMQASFNLQQLLSGLLILSFARLFFIFIANKKYVQYDLANVTANTTIYADQWKFLSMNEALDIVSRQVDKLFLLWLLSAGAFAIYFNGSYEIPLIGILISTSGTFLTMQTVEEQHAVPVKGLLQQSTLVLASILFPLFFFLFFNAEDLFRVIFAGRYNESVPVFLISCCIIPLRIMNYTAILQGYHKGKEILTGSVLGLISKLIVSAPLYFIWGVRGVALAFIIGTFLQMIYYLIKTAQLLHCGFIDLLPYIKLLLLFIVTGLLSYAAGLVHWNIPIWQTLTCKGILSCVVIATVLFVVFRKKNISA